MKMKKEIWWDEDGCSAEKWTCQICGETVYVQSRAIEHEKIICQKPAPIVNWDAEETEWAEDDPTIPMR